MSRATLAVVCDQLRTLGLEDVARWVENPDAVRELLKHEPTYADFNDRTCPCCGVGDGEAHRRGELPHDEHCRIAAAWRALGDPRGAADIERAHEEALRENRGPGRWVALHRTPMGRAEQAQQLLRDGLITTEQLVRILAYPEDMAGGVEIFGQTRTA